MSSKTRVGFLACASALTLTGVSLAGTGADANDYETRIAELERQIAELRGTDVTSEARAAEIEAIVADVLADADTRSSLLQSGGGWSGGFVLGDGSGAYSLRISGQLQTRFIAGLRDNSADDAVYGFDNGRTRVVFSGNIVDETWTYRVQTQASNTTGAMSIADAYIGKDLGNGYSLRMGQMKTGVLREEGTSSSRQLAVERSLVNERFNQGRVQGVQLRYGSEDGTYGASVTLHDGGGRTNMAWNDATAGDTEFAVSGRFDWALQGDLSRFKDFTSNNSTEETAIRVGGGFGYEKEASGVTHLDAFENEIMTLTVDAAVEGAGWNAFGAFVYQDVDDDGTTSFSGMGIVAQGGYYFTDDLEGFARYEWGDADTGGTTDDLNLITVGVNKYWASHNAKLTADVGYSLDPIGTWGSAARAGWQADGTNEDGQMVLRAQLQLLF